MFSEEEEKTFYCNYNEHVIYRLVNAKETMRDQFEASLPEAGRRFSAIRSYLNSSMSILEIGSATRSFLHLIRGDVRDSNHLYWLQYGKPSGAGNTVLFFHNLSIQSIQDV